jgi:purine-binding chemotaxis protein CheW
MAEYADNVYNEEEDSQRGRYLTFTIEDDVYGVSIRFVTEIIGIQSVTKVPETPDYIKGITNLRGRIIPLIDVRLKFGKPEIPYTDRTCVVVADTGEVIVGLIVDRVDDVLTIPDDRLAAAPEGMLGFEDRYVEGVGNMDDKAILLLDMERFLRADEAEAVEGATGQSGAAATIEGTGADE